MPTYDVLASFWRDWRSLTPQQRVVLQAVEQFIADLRVGAIRPALRVKRVRAALERRQLGACGAYEIPNKQ